MKIVSRDEVKDLIGEAVLVDVREEWEVEEYGTIPTAINIPLTELPEALAMNVTKRAQKYGASFEQDALIVFFCRSGGRSYRATAFALQQGFARSANYSGSILDWADIDPKVRKY
jgi:rhodanese-related sulfurtransferase